MELCPLKEAGECFCAMYGESNPLALYCFYAKMAVQGVDSPERVCEMDGCPRYGVMVLSDGR